MFWAVATVTASDTCGHCGNPYRYAWAHKCPPGSELAHPIDAPTRVRILAWASHITPYVDRSDAATVARNAIPLLEFAERATSATDLRARLDAMSRQCSNSNPGSGDLDSLVAEAGIYYAFITAAAGASGDLL